MYESYNASQRAYDLFYFLLSTLAFQIVKQSWNLEKRNHSHVLICHPETLDNLFYNSV